jgi:hypothetical protein
MSFQACRRRAPAIRVVLGGTVVGVVSALSLLSKTGTDPVRQDAEAQKIRETLRTRQSTANEQSRL